MKRVWITAIAMMLALLMIVPASAADNGVEWDFEEYNDNENFTDEVIYIGNSHKKEVYVTSKDGNKALMIDSSAFQPRTLNFNLYFNKIDYLTKSEKFVIQCDMLFDDLSATYWQLFMICHYKIIDGVEKGEFLPVATIRDGNLLFCENSTNGADLTATVEGYEKIETNKWYNFATVYDFTANKYEFYVDGKLVYSSSITFAYEFAEEDQTLFRFESYQNVGGKAFFDNLKLYSADLPDGYVADTPEDNTPEDDSPTNPGSPATGDAMMLVSISGIAVASAGVVVATKKKKR